MKYMSNIIVYFKVSAWYILIMETTTTTTKRDTSTRRRTERTSEPSRLAHTFERSTTPLAARRNATRGKGRRIERTISGCAATA